MFKRPFIIGFALVATLLAGCTSSLEARLTNPAPIVPINSVNVFNLRHNKEDVVGHTFIARSHSNETLGAFARQYDMGALEMQESNPGMPDGWLKTNAKVIVPSKFILPPEQYRQGIVINIAELRLYYFDNNSKEVFTFPVALGRSGWSTPLTQTYIYRKEAAPTWHVPTSVKQYLYDTKGKQMPDSVPPGPDNPLGDYALYLQLNGYLIHGTNEPGSIGRLVSSGCIRMYNEDVTKLYEKVDRGTPVRIIYYPNKVGWRDNHLYLEVHKPIPHEQSIYQSQEISIAELIKEAVAHHPAKVNWKLVRKVKIAHTGIPTVIGVAR